MDFCFEDYTTAWLDHIIKHTMHLMMMFSTGPQATRSVSVLHKGHIETVYENVARAVA